MQVQYDKYFDERGQITVFLSLLFLVLMMSFLFIVEGVISYSASSLGEDAVKGAGESIMANYDRELFKNYHLFFLDPRQKDYIVTDGKEFINQYFSGNSFFDIYCDSLEVTGEKTAVDEDGLYLKHEIREWMKYREEKEIAKVLEDIIRNTKKNDGERKECQEEVDSAETDVKKEQDEEVNQETKEETNKKDTESDLKGDVDKNTDNVEDMKPDEKAASEEIEPVSEETLKERSNWKEIKGTLQLLMRTGILFYAAEHPESLSRQSIPGTNLPSKRVKGSSFDNEQRLLDKMDELSFSSLKGIKSLLSVDISMDGRGTLWTKDRYIISYIEDCFSFYGGSDKKDNALLYEVEYLISGKNSDIDNLKRVANYILLLRFINNYIFTGKDTQMKTHINTMASAITGVMGMPQTMKAVQVLIRMAISYGESLLELHTLFSGGEVPLIKDKTTWNLTLKTMAEQLRNKQIVKKGKKNISYKDYLKLFLLTKGNSRTVCYRMMDIMQENIKDNINKQNKVRHRKRGEQGSSISDKFIQEKELQNRPQMIKTEVDWEAEGDWESGTEGTTILNYGNESEKEDGKICHPMLRDMELGIIYVIKNCPFYIGSAEGVNHLHIQDKTVSREHAVILEDIYEGDGQGYILRDMGSTNGTWLNGKKIKRGNQEQLEDGAVIRFAKKEYEFLIQDI